MGSAEVLCLMPLCDINSLKSALMKQDALSDTRISGSPWVAKTVLSFCSITSVDVDATVIISNHLE